MKSRLKEKNACLSEESKVGAKRILLQRSLMVAAMLLVAVAVLLPAGSQASAADYHYSNWIKDLSALADPNALYYHQDPKVAVSGNYVHVVWFAWKTDSSRDNRLFHARSVNGGQSFGTPVALASGSGVIEVPRQWNNLVASGPYVHVVYITKTEAEWPHNLVYLRSKDNGATFQKKTLSSGTFSYNGVSICAEGKKVALVWAYSNGDGSKTKDIFCKYSTDGGTTLKTTQMAHSAGDAIVGYTVYDAVRSLDYVYVLTSTMDNVSDYQQHLYLWASTNGGATFKDPVKVNVKAVNNGYYLQGVVGQYSAEAGCFGRPGKCRLGQRGQSRWVRRVVCAHAPDSEILQRRDFFAEPTHSAHLSGRLSSRRELRTGNHRPKGPRCLCDNGYQLRQQSRYLSVALLR
ncbi:MAG: hypothetical protein AB9866_23290 [Syntrophobacteraceae bacterium]